MQLAYFESHWRKLWQREVHVRPDLEQWLVELDALPEFPARTPWTVGAIRAVLHRMAKRKAPGLDSWMVQELRLLPDELLEWVAQ